MLLHGFCTYKRKSVEMDVSNEFIEQSIIAKYYSETFNDNSSDHEFHNEIYYLCIDEVFKSFKINAEKISKVLFNLKRKRYAEAKVGLGIRDDYCNYQKDITALRYEIKSLTSGLIVTSSITNVDDIKKYKSKWFEYGNSLWYHYHQSIYKEFTKVNTMDELVKFNVYFQNYIIELVYRFTEIFIRRMRYTVLYLSQDKTIEASCRDVYIDLVRFIEEIEVQKINSIQRKVISNRSLYAKFVMQIKQYKKHLSN